MRIVSGTVRFTLGEWPHISFLLSVKEDAPLLTSYDHVLPFVESEIVKLRPSEPQKMVKEGDQIFWCTGREEGQPLTAERRLVWMFPEEFLTLPFDVQNQIKIIPGNSN